MQGVYLRVRRPDQLDSTRDKHCAGPAPERLASGVARHGAQNAAECETPPTSGASRSSHGAVSTYRWRPA